MTKHAVAGTTMTDKDWNTVQKTYEMHLVLIQGIETVKTMRGEKKKKEHRRLKGHAHDYSRFLQSPETQKILAKCFGGEEVVAELCILVRELVSQHLKA